MVGNGYIVFRNEPLLSYILPIRVILWVPATESFAPAKINCYYELLNISQDESFKGYPLSKTE